jgi:TonB family protein
MNTYPSFSFPARTILLACLLLAATQSGADRIPEYVPPDVLSASNIPYPPNTQATGAVSLLLSIDNNAQIQGMQPLRDLPPLTSAVQDSVQLWTFKPALRKGNPIPSEIPLTVIFNIFNPGGGAAYQSLVLAPAQPSDADASQFTPPQITLASFAKYPPASTAQGTVVLDITVGRSGQAKQFRVINDVPTLTPQAISAVKTWKFNAATYKSQPIAAQIIIAFVFQRNVS